MACFNSILEYTIAVIALHQPKTTEQNATQWVANVTFDDIAMPEEELYFLHVEEFLEMQTIAWSTLVRGRASRERYSVPKYEISVRRVKISYYEATSKQPNKTGPQGKTADVYLLTGRFGRYRHGMSFGGRREMSISLTQNETAENGTPPAHTSDYIVETSNENAPANEPEPDDHNGWLGDWREFGKTEIVINNGQMRTKTMTAREIHFPEKSTRVN